MSAHYIPALEALVILYLRVIPGFWVAVEEAARPHLRSRPLIIGSSSQGRGLVHDVNLVAQHCGVRTGMSLAQARQYCPDGLFLTPDLPRYEALWEEVCMFLSTLTPLVEPLEMGHAFCDITGCERRWRTLWEAGAEIRRLLMQRGMDSSIGIAANKIVAQLASTDVGPDGITIVECGQERTFLTDLPLTTLPDIDPRMALTFQVLGLRTIGQFAALPAAAVRQRFGAEGERLHRWACGHDPRPVVPPPARPAVSVFRECEDGTAEEAVVVIHCLAEECAAELQRRGVAGKLITLILEPRDSLSLLSRQAAHAVPACTEEPVLPALRAQPSGSQGGEGLHMPIPYRIHSMLPQPGNSRQLPAHNPQPKALQLTPGHGGPGLHHGGPGLHLPLATEGRGYMAHPWPQGAGATQLIAHSSRLTAHKSSVRTAISTAGPLEERAQAMLQERWPREDGKLVPIGRITLEVSEFDAPIQLSFVELSRIDAAGGLRGMDSNRLRALVGGEQVLTARYGDASFRHVTHVDPSSVLTERRFRWKGGLPPSFSPAQGGRPKRTGRRRRGS